MRRWLPRLVLSLTFASAAHAGGVAIHGDPTGTIHATLQSAIDAAPEGAVLVIGAGSYAGFGIDGKSLSLVATTPTGTKITGSATIENLTAAQHVLLDRLHFIPPAKAPGAAHGAALRVQDCAGDVRLQLCELIGAAGPTGAPVTGGDDALVVLNSASVVVLGTDLRGGLGGTDCSAVYAGDGGHGLAVTAAKVVFAEGDLFGGAGGQGQVGGLGGHGAWVTTGSLFAAGSQVRGGAGGAACAVGWGGEGGDGFHVETLAKAWSRACSVGGGAGGAGQPPSQNGQPGQNFEGLVWSQSTPVRSVLGPALVAEGTTLSLDFDGEIGDAAYLAFSPRPGLKLPSTSVQFNAWLIPYPAKLTVSPLVTLPTGSPWPISIDVPWVAAGASSVAVFAQSLAYDLAGQFQVGAARELVVLAAVPGSDCNGNGVADAIDLWKNTSADHNGNARPDECEEGVTRYVDPLAPPGGDGSLGAPFDRIQLGLDQSVSGDELVLLDGLYTGAGNVDCAIDGCSLVIRSQNGPANCVIDCEGTARALAVTGDTNATTRLEGVTIRNAFAQGESGAGVLIDFGAAQLTISNCAFENGELVGAGDGSAVFVGQLGRVSIEDCTFRDNRGGHGAVVIASLSSLPSRVIRSTFADNGSLDPSFATLLVEREVQVDVSQCTFRQNQGQRAAAIWHAPKKYGRLRVEGSLFVGNFGAPAIGCDTGSTASALLQLDVADCTFVDNRTGSAGSTSSIWALNFTRVRVANSIFWRVAPNADSFELALRDVVGYLEVAACDVWNGMAGVSTGGGTLNWGPVNVASDPLFVDPDGPDDDVTTYADNVYRLQSNSPLLDAGAVTYLPPDFADLDGDGDTNELVPLDLNGKPRRKDLPFVPDTGIGPAPIVDIGCYERQN